MKNLQGSSNPNWKGGKSYNHEYIMVFKPNHPFAVHNRYIREHRLVWEQHNKAILLPWSHVHHKNGIKTDNRIENLEAMTKNHHRYNHMIQDLSHRACNLCGSHKTHMQKKKMGLRPHWYKHNNDFICQKCYDYKRKHKFGADYE